MARAMQAHRPPRTASSRMRTRAGAQPGDRRIAEIQRARIIAAMFDVARERGAANVSVAHVVERSGVSRRTFYEMFDDREDCLLAAFEEALALACQRVLAAYRREGRWRERIRASLIALLSFLDEEPLVGRLLIVESLSGGERMLERRRRALAQLAAALDEGRAQSQSAAGLPALTGESLVGGALSVVHSRMVRSHGEPLLGLSNQLMSMIVMPYLGSAAARRELERPVERPEGGSNRTRLLVDPFKDAGMRLTYRTVRVLLAVAEHPSASNRIVGETAGINDQGQISKLLGRLKRLGLITNTGLAPGQGAPNAWTLTATGQQMIESIRNHTRDAIEVTR